MPARKHHTVDEIVVALRQMQSLTDEGTPVAVAAASLGITDQTYYRWRSRYGTLSEDEATRLRDLDEERARLQRVIDEQAQDIVMLRDLAKSERPDAAQRRDAVAYLVGRYGISERRACRLVGQHRSTQRYGGVDRPGPEAGDPPAAAQPTSGFGSERDNRDDHGDRDPREPGWPLPAPRRIPWLDDYVPGFSTLRAGLVHDLMWVARDSEMARLSGVRALVHRLERLAAGYAHSPSPMGSPGGSSPG